MQGLTMDELLPLSWSWRGPTREQVDGSRAFLALGDVREQRRSAEPHWALEPRIPSEQYFFFRGGWHWPRLGRHARRLDYGLAPTA